LALLTALDGARTVAIMDDDPTFCHTLSDVLKQRGFYVVTITDPHADIAKLMEGAQVILLDMKLNHISGLDVLKEIRRRDQHIPVFLITGYGQEMAATIERAVELNVYACLYKPVEMPELLQKLGEIQTGNLKRLIDAQ
jgi:DNA-binding response OmpR family regulator